MAVEQEKLFTGITRVQLDRVRSRLRSRGFDVPAGDIGDMRGHEATIDVEYNENKQTLSFGILQKPERIAHSYYWTMLDQEVKRP